MRRSHPPHQARALVAGEVEAAARLHVLQQRLESRVRQVHARPPQSRHRRARSDVAHDSPAPRRRTGIGTRSVGEYRVSWAETTVCWSSAVRRAGSTRWSNSSRSCRRDLPACVLVTVHIARQRAQQLPRILARSGPLPGGPRPARGTPAARPDLRRTTGPAPARRRRHGPPQQRAPGEPPPSGDRRDVRQRRAVRRATRRRGRPVGGAGRRCDRLGSRGAGRRAVIVQDPADALFASMPRSALVAVPGATPAPAARMGKVATEIVGDCTTCSERAARHRRRGRPADHGRQLGEQEGGPEMHETRMGDGDDPGFLSADEARLTRMSCPSATGASRRST